MTSKLKTKAKLLGLYFVPATIFVSSGVGSAIATATLYGWEIKAFLLLLLGIALAGGWVCFLGLLLEGENEEDLFYVHKTPNPKPGAWKE